jgi:hypothetical protein
MQLETIFPRRAVDNGFLQEAIEKIGFEGNHSFENQYFFILLIESYLN